jgi:hypothetical protein
MNAELTPEVAESLIDQGFESPNLDYKAQFDNTPGAWMEVAKDVYGMANAGGGYIVFGVEDGTFKPVGMDESFHVDSQTWADKFSKWINGKITLSYLEHVTRVGEEKRKFPILYIHGSTSSLAIPKDNGIYQNHDEKLTAFNKGVIYTRQNTSTVAATGEEFWKIFWSLSKRTATLQGSEATPLEVISLLNKKAEPAVIEETLWFNLFPVIEIPDYIHVANTDFRTAREIYEEITRQTEQNKSDIDIPAFFLADRMIYSFAPFDEDNPLTLCITSNGRRIPTKEWLDSKRKHQDLVKLLNYNLKDLCWKKGFLYDLKRDRYYIKYSGGPIPEVTWKPYSKSSSRELVHTKLKESGELVYIEHFGARMRFIILGDGIYLTIEPIRVLTLDGMQLLDQRLNTRISTRKNALYHNNNYLYDTKLWCHILAGNREEIHLGNGVGRITVSILAINSKVNFGILDDRHTGGDFLDSLKSEPMEYLITNEDTDEDNPLTESALEE